MTHGDQLSAAVVRWHEAVNSSDLDAARRAVTDPVVVNGPRGAGAIDPDGFARWIVRSGIQLKARSWHPAGDRLVVVEQEARWPQDPAWSRVATVFRVTSDLVSAALRFPDLQAAREFAALHVALVATEHPAGA